MKKVRFRVWQTFHKKMLTVTDLHFDKNGNIKGVTVRNTPDTIPTTISYGLEKDFGLTYEGKETLVLIQSTNLKDKNGKEIFEGDIVKSQKKDDVVRFSKYQPPKIQEVFFSERYVCLMLRDVKTKQEDFLDREQFEKWRDFEIIGNIYENPELLKEDK